MKIEAEITVYEMDGDEKYMPDELLIRSHWNRDEMIILRIGNGKSITVLARDLKEAIDRCSGWRH